MYKNFICKSSVDFPRTITYRDWVIDSRGEGGNRYIHVQNGRQCMITMWIDTHTDDACFIHSVWTEIEDLRLWLEETCTRKDSYSWDYKTWDDVDKFMQKLVDYIKNM